MITIYTDVDSLFDTRRGIINKLALENGHLHFNWDTHFKATYEARRYDIFDMKAFGITEETYAKRFSKRSLEDFNDQYATYVFPSQLIYSMFNIVRELEFGVGMMMSNDAFRLTVNTFPYVFLESQLRELELAIRGAVKFGIELDFVHIPYKGQSPSYLHRFNYVFKYDFLLSEDMKGYFELYPAAQPSNVRIVVPDILARKTQLPEGMDQESPFDLISKFSMTQGGKITLVPVSKTVFDYK